MQWVMFILVVITKVVCSGECVRFGAAVVNLKAADTMQIAGGIHPGSAQGQ